MKSILLFILLIILSTAGLVFYQYHRFNDGYLHVVFCSVGQGDAILIRTPHGSDILYDGGPDQKVLACLTDHLPFWDRSIELMLLSHPHADHLVGLLSVMKRYTVLSFDTEELKNKTAMFTSLLDLLQREHTERRYVLAGDRFRTADGVLLQVLGPSKKYLQETSPNGLIGEKKEFASVIVHLSYGDFDLLLDGDSQVAGLSDGLGRSGGVRQLGALEVMQVPHHGSATGLDAAMVQRLQPKLAVISVGKNTYGHPAKSTIALLEKAGIKTVRTDKNGNIEILSDGEKWWVK